MRGVLHPAVRATVRGGGSVQGSGRASRSAVVAVRASRSVPRRRGGQRPWPGLACVADRIPSLADAARESAGTGDSRTDPCVEPLTPRREGV